MILPHNVEQVLRGSLLGDGYLACYRYKKRKQRNAIFREGHCLKQADYLRWKTEILSCFGSRLCIIRGYSKGKIRGGILLYTCVHPMLTELWKLWYPNFPLNGRKVLPEMELQKLDELGLAVWYQDDGCYSYGQHCCLLCINGFKGQEQVIQSWFEERWELNPSIRYTTSNHPFLQFSVKDSDKLLRLIAKHIHPSMSYKLGWHHSANQSRVNAENKKERERSRQKWWKNHDENIIQQRKYRQDNWDKIRQRNREFYRKHWHQCVQHSSRQKSAMKIYKENQSIWGFSK